MVFFNKTVAFNFYLYHCNVVGGYYYTSHNRIYLLI